MLPLRLRRSGDSEAYLPRECARSRKLWEWITHQWRQSTGEGLIKATDPRVCLFGDPWSMCQAEARGWVVLPTARRWPTVVWGKPRSAELHSRLLKGSMGAEQLRRRLERQSAKESEGAAATDAAGSGA